MVTETKEQAVAEEKDTSAQTGAKEAVTPTAETEQTPSAGAQPTKGDKETPIGSENPTAKKERFEENPGFKNLMRQRDSFKEELKQARESNAKLLAFLENQSKAPRQEAELSEQQQAIQQLSKLLGIENLTNDLKSLKSIGENFSKSQEDAAYNKEDQEIQSLCQQFSLPVDQVYQEIEEYLNTDPYLSKLDMKPGLGKLAFAALYLPKLTDLAERSAFKKQTETKEKLRKGNGETPAPSSKGDGSPTDATMGDYIDRLIREGGGVVT